MQCFRLEGEKSRLCQLVYQNSRHAIDDQTGEQFARIFSSLNKLDLRRSVLTDEAVARFIQVIAEKDTEKGLSTDRLDLTGCSFSKTSLEEFEEINKRKGISLVLLGAFDDIENANRGECRCRCFRCFS